MSNEQKVTWWQEQLSGLEIDACPAIDMPDNAQGGAFASLTVAAGRVGDRDDLTAAFAYALGKYTSQNESLFWVREGGAFYPFYTSFDENAPAPDYRASVASRRSAALQHLGPAADALAEALCLSRELLLCLDADAEPDAAEDWKLCLRAQAGALTLFYRQDWFLAGNMRRFAETVARIAYQLPDAARLRDMSLISQEDLATLRAFPHWDLPPSARSVPEILARAVSQYPDNIAVVYEGEALTYASWIRRPTPSPPGWPGRASAGARWSPPSCPAASGCPWWPSRYSRPARPISPSTPLTRRSA